MVNIVATTSLPVDRIRATDCNAAARAKILATTLLPVDRLRATDCNAAARANFVYDEQIIWKFVCVRTNEKTF